ncbi:unnamed protein product [Brassica rapa]|uniref:Anaphase-promoting complex subunit 4 WD40 domain-containing protein n=1 Tax=Brassica campestris TaxID=3711 RepID=A0A8D9GXF5_BRACM|nr:unnamed protein product [Brassica rapa]
MKNGNYLKGRRLIKHKKRRILWTRVRLIWFWEVSSPTTKSQKIPIVFELHTSFVLFLREFVFIVLIVRPAHIFCSQVQSPHTGHEHHVLAVAWSPDANCLVSGDRNEKVCCWDPSKGELQGKALAVNMFR